MRWHVEVIKMDKIKMESPYGLYPIECSFMKGHSGEHGASGRKWFMRWQ
jgi:hypothetical protein